jgi:hypothetical protein
MFQLYHGGQLVEETGVLGENQRPVASHLFQIWILTKLGSTLTVILHEQTTNISGQI